MQTFTNSKLNKNHKIFQSVKGLQYPKIVGPLSLPLKKSDFVPRFQISMFTNLHIKNDLMELERIFNNVSIEGRRTRQGEK